MSYARYKTGFYHNYGTIIGQQGIYFSGAGATLVNSGSIAGTSGNAVRMADGGRVVNAGAITGTFIGVSSGASLYLSNSNYISGTDFGVVVAGGTVLNSGDGFTTNGRIAGGIDGVLSSGFTTVGNGYGSIYGGRYGVNLESGGTVSNDIGYISGGQSAINIEAGGYVTNSGEIEGGRGGSGDGVDLRAGGRVTNYGGHDIGTTGGRAIYSYAADQAGFVTNYGEIRAGGDRSIGVYLKGNYSFGIAGGDVFDKSGGYIFGATAISITNDGYVSNAGRVNGYNSYGIRISGSGYVTNVVGGTIIGGIGGVVETGSDSRLFNAGSIGGVFAAELQGSGAEVVNEAGGTLAGSDIGIVLGDGGTVFNEKAGTHVGTISGANYYGILVEGASGTIDNSGVVKAFYRAIDLTAGGSVTNAATGVIDGYGGFPGMGVAIYGASGTVTNSGSINGAGYYGVKLDLSGGGTVTNTASGRISGGLDGVRGLGVPVAVSNAGSIAGGRYGVYLGAGGSIANKVGATISGASAGIVIAGGTATVTNAGTLAGTYAVHFTGGTDTLVIDPGAVFHGRVTCGPSAVGALVLAAGASAGSISGLGTSFKGFQTITEKAGANWRVTGTNSLGAGVRVAFDGTLTVSGTLAAPGSVSIAGLLTTGSGGLLELGNHVSMSAGSTLSTNPAGRVELGTGGGAAGTVRVNAGATLTGAGTVNRPVVDNGKIVAQGGTLALTGTVAGTGSLEIASHAFASITGALSVKDLVFLAGGHEEAIFGAPTDVGAIISGFTLATDMMDLKGFVATHETVSGHVMTLTRSGGSAAHLHFAGSYTSSQFSIGSDGHGGTLLRVA